MKSKMWMRRARSRQGFSLTEVIFATAITMIVLSQTAVALVACIRVMQATMADVELSVQTRALREKVLYNVCEDGGLMNVCNSELEFSNSNKGWGDGVAYKPSKGPKNRLQLSGAKKKLIAGKSKHVGWLDCGKMEFQDSQVFGNRVSNGVIRVNFNMALAFGARRFMQRHQADVQIMNE